MRLMTRAHSIWSCLSSRNQSSHRSVDQRNATTAPQRVSEDVVSWQGVFTKQFFALLTRTLLAVFLTISTFVVLFFVPVDRAHGAQVWWDLAGNGYAANGDFWVGDAVRDINLPYPKIETVRVNGRMRTKITWSVIFNANGLANKSVENNQLPKGHAGDDGGAFQGGPMLYAWIPTGVEDESIRIDREYTKRYINGGPGSVGFDWVYQQREANVSNFRSHGVSYSYASGDAQFHRHWTYTLGEGKFGLNGFQQPHPNFNHNMCEVRKWKDSRQFSRMLASWEIDDQTLSYKWTISGLVKEGVNPLTLPFATGWNSGRTKHLDETSSDTSYRDKWAFIGPYDTDGDGIPDIVEHHHSMDPKNKHEQIKYPFYTNGMLSQYGKKENLPLGAYGSPITVKPYSEMGHWVGDSATGHFQKDGKTTTQLPTNLGIRYSLSGNLPTGVKQANSATNLPEGSVYINATNGQLTYNPKKTDRNKTLTFPVKITYPNPESYNCMHKTRVEETNQVKVHVASMATLYSPKYDMTTLKAGVEGLSGLPYNDLDRTRSFPDGTKFEIKKYGNSTDPLNWSQITPFDTQRQKVFFSPNKSMSPGKYQTPVLVTYPDGSSSADADSGNKGKPVYAPVTVTPPDVSNNDLHLNIHKGKSGNTLGVQLGKDEVVKLTKGKKLDPELYLDSWSSLLGGSIQLRTICYENKNGKQENYTVGEINGIKLGATQKIISQGVAERSQASITGVPTNNGSFVCTVYALKNLQNDNTSKLADNFDTAYKTLGQEFFKHVNNLFKPDKEGKLWRSKTIKFNVNSLSHFYNPKYEETKVTAGEKGVSFVPKSVKNANGVNADTQQDVTVGALPDGTWFEFKQYKDDRKKPVLEWASWEPESESNKPSNPAQTIGKDSSDRSGVKYGKVTFRPNKWEKEMMRYAPVVVHYPDGSTSEDPDSGNLGKPVYAPVQVVRPTLNNPDLILKLHEYYLGPHVNDKGIHVPPGTALKKDLWIDSWSMHKPGMIEHRVICHKVNPKTGKLENYTLGGINGLKIEGIKQWKHASYEQQKRCRADKKQCEPNTYLYDDDVEGGKSENTTERTQAYIKGKANEVGDYGCTIYALKKLSDNGNSLVDKFDRMVKRLSTSPEVVLSNINNAILNNKPGTRPEESALRDVDWTTLSFQIHVHKQAHYYNPSYFEVSTTAGVKKESPNPVSAASANGVENKNPNLRTGVLPDGTWFEIKKYAKHGDSADPLPWARFADGQSNAPANAQSNGPGKDASAGSGGKYGKVTFHPDVSIAAKKYQVPVIVHYPDGSTSEDEDSGNHGMPIYAVLKVNPLKGVRDIHMEVYKSDNLGNGTLGRNNPLTVMRGINFIQKPLIRTWSVKNKEVLHLRLLCNNKQENAWSNNNNNIHLPSFGEASTRWTFATEAQRKACRERGECGGEHLLYGFLNNTQTHGAIENAIARTEDRIDGAPERVGDYNCSVFAMTDKGLQAFQQVTSGKPSVQNAISMKLPGVTQGVDWDRITFPVHVVDRFTLPKTGETNWNYLVGVVLVIGTGLIAAVVVLDQCKWSKTATLYLSCFARVANALNNAWRFIGNIIGRW